jgi:uncharacterized membrane protein
MGKRALVCCQVSCEADQVSAAAASELVCEAKSSRVWPTGAAARKKLEKWTESRYTGDVVANPAQPTNPLVGISFRRPIIRVGVLVLAIVAIFLVAMNFWRVNALPSICILVGLAVYRLKWNWFQPTSEEIEQASKDKSSRFIVETAVGYARRFKRPVLMIAITETPIGDHGLHRAILEKGESAIRAKLALDATTYRVFSLENVSLVIGALTPLPIEVVFSILSVGGIGLALWQQYRYPRDVRDASPSAGIAKRFASSSRIGRLVSLASLRSGRRSSNLKSELTRRR